MTDQRPAPTALQMPVTLRQNIAALAERAHAERAREGWSDRLAGWITAFTGSMLFVVVHLVLYGVWIGANLGWVPGIARFDPSFVILAMEASVEAIFLSTFVLISQNRMQANADRRADLDLHINLLTEHELTKLAVLVDRIADKLQIADRDPEMQEVKHDVRPVEVLDAIDAHGKQAH